MTIAEPSRGPRRVWRHRPPPGNRPAIATIAESEQRFVRFPELARPAGVSGPVPPQARAGSFGPVHRQPQRRRTTVGIADQVGARKFEDVQQVGDRGGEVAEGVGPVDPLGRPPVPRHIRHDHSEVAGQLLDIARVRRQAGGAGTTTVQQHYGRTGAGIGVVDVAVPGAYGPPAVVRRHRSASSSAAPLPGHATEPVRGALGQIGRSVR